MKLTLLLSGLIVTTTGYCAQDITIWELARNGNIDAIKRHMTTGADLDQKNMQESGWAALHYASIYNRADAAKLLIENGANIEIKCDAGRTPLLEAAVRGQTKVAKVLIELGADVTASEKFGTSALGLAVMSGNTTMVELILKSGVDINVNTDNTKKTSAFTSLHIAASRPKAVIMRYLLMNGANVNANGNLGYSPFHIAAYNGNIEGVKLLLEKGADLKSKTNTGATVLMEAARGGRTEIAKLLIAEGANIHATDNRGSTLLHLSSGDVELVKLLIAKGADVNAKDDDGSTPLNTSLVKLKISTGLSRYRDAIEKFASRGYEVNVESLESTTPRHTKSLVNLLISHGANVNAKDKLGRTPLHLTSNNVDLAELLIEKGANMNARDRKGQTPLDYNSRHSHTKNIQDFLRNNGGLTGKELIDASMLREAVRNGDLQKVKQAMANGLDINATDGNNNTALDLALKNKEIADLLRKHGGKTGEELKDKAK